MAGGETLIVIDTVAGLPATGLPVSGSIALTITLVVNDEPPGTPVALTMTFTEAFAPAARSVPASAESETKDGAPEASAAVQFRCSPPEFPMVKGWDVVPVITLKVSEPGLTVRVGGASTFSVTPTVCGLPVIAIPPSIAAIEIEPVYGPAASAADVITTVKVALPLVIVAKGGVTANQPVPDPSVTVGVMVTLPVHAPMIAIVKVCVAGFKPASALKVSPVVEGDCSVQGGCTDSVTVTTCGVPMDCPVTLSVAVIVTVPV